MKLLVALWIVALLAACATPQPSERRSPAPQRSASETPIATPILVASGSPEGSSPLVYLAYATPLSQTFPPDDVQPQTALIVVFADGLAVARDRTAPMDPGEPALRALQLSEDDVRSILDGLDLRAIRDMPPAEEHPDMSWMGQQDRVIGFILDGQPHEVRHLGLSVDPAPPAFEEAVRRLDRLAERLDDEGQPWSPDSIHTVPTVPEGTAIEG